MAETLHRRHDRHGDTSYIRTVAMGATNVEKPGVETQVPNGD